MITRILRDNKNELKLGFDMGRKGEKTYAVKGLEKLVGAVDGKNEFALTKAISINFATETFTESSLKWFRMISSRVRTVHKVNDTLNNRSGGYNYYYGYNSSKELSVGTGIPLAESDLDMLYDMVHEEGEIHYQYGGRSDVDIIPVGEMSPRINVELTLRKDGSGIVGVKMDVRMPEMLQGSQHSYILDYDGFGRVPDQQIGHLRMFRQVFGSFEQYFTCIIGKKKVSDFFYRILPMLQKAGDIALNNKLGSEIEEILPPAAEFTFYIDITDNEITCRTEVRYDELVFPLGFRSGNPQMVSRDSEQENRVLNAVIHFFSHTDEEKQQFTAPADEEKVLSVLTDGVAVLSEFGEVKGSSAFHRINFRPVSQPCVVVRIDSGLLDLSIQTKDLSEDELLEILNGYRLRKRWYRFKNGDYVNLQDAEGLEELDETIRLMNVDINELIHGGIKLPL